MKYSVQQEVQPYPPSFDELTGSLTDPCFRQQVTTVETVEGGMHGEELWGVEQEGSEAQRDEEKMLELQSKIEELEQQVENYKKALEESMQELEANRLMELVEQISVERDNLARKCKDFEEKTNADDESNEDWQSVVEGLKTRLIKSEEDTQELSKELSAKSQTELDMLMQIKELQDELAKELEALTQAQQMKDKLKEDLVISEETQRDLEREKETIQKQLNEAFLQISALRVIFFNHKSTVVVLPDGICRLVQTLNLAATSYEALSTSYVLCMRKKDFNLPLSYFFP